MKKVSKSITASLIVLLTIIIAPAAGIKFEPVRGVNSGLPANELTWQKHAGASEEEHTFMIGFFEGGIHLFLTFFTMRYGMFQKWGFYTLIQEDGKEKNVFVKGECPEGAKGVSHTNYDIKCGQTSYSGNWPDFTLNIRDPELNADVKFHAIVPPFTPGKTLFSPDGSIHTKCVISVPRAKTEATLTYGGKTVKVTGEGYTEHGYQNTSFTRQGPVFYAVRGFPDPKTPPDDQIYINFSSQEIHKSYGGGYDAFMFAVRGNKIIGVTRKLVIQPLEQATDPETGYKYVKRVTIKADDPEMGFNGMFSVAKNIEIMDVFKWLPSYVRKIVATLFKRPVYFRFLGTIEGQLKIKENTFTIRQRATSEMNFTQ